jgi:hypothetical protein
MPEPNVTASLPKNLKTSLLQSSNKFSRWEHW